MARKIKDLDQYLTKKTGADAETREKWREKLRDLSERRQAETDPAKKKEIEKEYLETFRAGPRATTPKQ